MSRIPTPATIDTAPAASRPMLEAVKKQLGVVPNMFRLVSKAILAGPVSKGALPAATRERIALAVAEVNGCDYCLSAHTYLGKNLAKLDDAEITANRNGASNDAKADAAAIGDAGGACHCARRHAALRAVTTGKSISVLATSLM